MFLLSVPEIGQFDGRLSDFGPSSAKVIDQDLWHRLRNNVWDALYAGFKLVVL
jgi:hypothetical protein